jgi:hypothetical protein
VPHEVELTPAERRIYELVCQGDIMCKQISHLDSGAVPSLIRKGLLEVYSKQVSPTRGKRLKFLRKL